MNACSTDHQQEINPAVRTDWCEPRIYLFDVQ